MLKAGSARAGCSGTCPVVQLGFEYFQGWRLYNISVQPVPVFDHPYSKKVFS